MLVRPYLAGFGRLFLGILFLLALPLEASPRGTWPATFTVVSLGEKQDSFPASIFQGQPLLVQFWASWCRSCSGISSELEEIVAPYVQTKPSRLRFLSVSIDETREAALKTVGRSHSSFLVDHSFHDARQELRTSLQVTSVPTIFVVDRRGAIVLRKEGHLSAGEYLEIKQALQRL